MPTTAVAPTPNAPVVMNFLLLVPSFVAEPGPRVVESLI
jgi:hypothetical protein